MSKNIIEIRDLDVYYGESQILRDIDMDIVEGNITAIMGRNGVGKTTLLKAITGLLASKKGSLKLGSEDAHPLDS